MTLCDWYGAETQTQFGSSSLKLRVIKPLTLYQGTRSASYLTFITGGYMTNFQGKTPLRKVVAPPVQTERTL